MSSFSLFRNVLQIGKLSRLNRSFSTSALLRVDEIRETKVEDDGNKIRGLNDITEMIVKQRILNEKQKYYEEHIEEQENEVVSYTSGVPEEHITERMARIAQVSKSAMQSGTDNTKSWLLQFDNRGRWENVLMGWVSTGDPLSNLQLHFNSKDEAIAYCKKNRYSYYVEKEKLTKPKVKSYAHNFSWNKRTRVSTK